MNIENNKIFIDTWQLIINCLRCWEQANIKLVSKSFLLLKYKNVYINIIPLTNSEHKYYLIYRQLRIKIDCDAKYIKAYISNIGYNLFCKDRVDDYGINMPVKEYIKEIINAIFDQTLRLASTPEEMINNKINHLLLENKNGKSLKEITNGLFLASSMFFRQDVNIENPNTFIFMSRSDIHDFVWEHLYFEVKQLK
jgi:hypothetical protein